MSVVLCMMAMVSALLQSSRDANAGQAETSLPHPLARTTPADRIGCTHVSGRYSFTDQDFLNEGADRILAAGMRVIKVYLHNPRHHYPFNSQWPEFESAVEIAEHPYFRALFRKPFTTYIMTVYAGGKHPVPWRDGLSEGERETVEREFHALARYLLRTYRGTGKTFVLQHWEGDWALRSSTNTAPEHDPTPTAIEGMIRWLNARQDGVEHARREVADTDVRVYHACEVNLVALAMEGRKTVTNDVVPNTRCDLYSYSAYDTIGVAAEDPARGRALFRRALDYLAAQALDSPAFGDKNVYIGEFGWPEVRSETDPGASTEKSLRVIRMTAETALDWGCPYVVYWQLYDNESRAGARRPENTEVRGFYLIKPDGTRAAAYDYLTGLVRAEPSVPGGPTTRPAQPAP